MSAEMSSFSLFLRSLLTVSVLKSPLFPTSGFGFTANAQIVFRPVALYKRAERVYPLPGQPADRADPEPQLGGRLQGPHHHTPHDVLRK